MKKIPTFVWVLAILAFAAGWNAYCDNPRIAKDALARAQDVRVDSLRAQMAYRESVALQRFQRTTDSLDKVIQRQRGRIVPRDTIRLTDTLVVGAQLDVRDSTIAALDERHRADSLEMLFWRKSAMTYRDSIVPALVASRDLWRKQSARRFVCAAGPGLTVGLDGRGAYGLGVTCGIRL